MKNKRAFTLIELLVVIAIIGILATLAIVALQQARQNSRDAKRVADVKQMSTALEMYFNEHQAYPESLDDLKGAGYMQIIPEAPIPADKGCEDSNDYNYSVSNNKDYYQLRFCTGKQVADLSPGNLCMTPGGLSIDCSTTALAPDPDPFCDPNDPVTFVDEDGNGYYDIHTCCELNAIRNNQSANYELVNNLDCSNTENWSQDIDGTTYEGFPTIVDFAGNLEGNNYAINNINLYEGYNNMAGIFSNSQSASVSVSNLKLINVNLNHRSSSIAGILFSQSNGPTVLSNVAILGGNIFHPIGSYVGGFIGEMSGLLNISNSSISNLSVSIDGVTGFGFFSSGYVSGGLIENSYVKNSSLTIGGNGGSGGLLRKGDNLTITNSYTDNLEVNSFNGAFFGHIGGELTNSNITDSYVRRSKVIVLPNDTVGYLGGIVGVFKDITVEKSFVDDYTLLAQSASVGNFGGLLGGGTSNHLSSSISNSHVRNLSVDSGSGNVGGFFAGFSSGGINIYNSSVKDAVLTRRSSGSIGGLIGYSSPGSSVILENSYFEGDISSLGENETAGGILGAKHGQLTLNNVYSVAKINYIGDGGSAGCDIGNSDSGMPLGDNNYYDSTVCTANEGLFLLPLSTSEMKDPSSYSGWNINTPSRDGADDSNPWRWTSGNYPCLYSDLTCKCS